MKLDGFAESVSTTDSTIAGWQVGRLHPTPSHVPTGWELVHLTSVARLESGHTPSRRKPEYWDGDIPWISLHDSNALDVPVIFQTAKAISKLGLENSSARLLPKGTVVFSRTATVGKATVMGREMATSQDFANYVCGNRVSGQFLMHLFRYMEREWSRLMAGSTHNTIYMPVFRDLQVMLPPRTEQEAIAAALSDVDTLMSSLNQLIAKKRDIKQAAMQQLLTGKQRLPGFRGEWQVRRLKDLGTTYGGLAGKTKDNFGHGAAYYVPFLNVMSNVVIDCDDFDKVELRVGESQNRVLKGDLLFNGSSETPEEVAMCALVEHDIENLYLNSFCFGFRLKSDALVHGLFLAYYVRGPIGRELVKSLAQGSTRYNLSKVALLNGALRLPERKEQTAIASVLSDMDAEIADLEQKRDKTRSLKQGMMQELLTGRIRIV